MNGKDTQESIIGTSIYRLVIRFTVETLREDNKEFQLSQGMTGPC